MKCTLGLKDVLVTWINLNLLITLSDGFQWISRPSNKTLAHVGSTVHITLHYNCDHKFGTSRIYFNDTPMFSRYSNEQNYSKMQNVDAYFFVIGGSNVTIIIPDVDKDKRGSYCCDVDCNRLLQKICTTLFTYALPHITYISPNLYGEQGDTITLRCNASGDPAARVTWIHQDTNTIVANSSVTSFNITGKASGGEYCCHVSNGYGDQTDCTTLEVTEYQPVNTELTSNTTFTVRNKTFRVVCKADASPPATYFIQQGDNRVVNSSDGNITVTTPVNGSSVNISCVAKNKYGEGEVAYLKIPIYQPPVCHPNSTVTMKDSSITLRCNVTGTPTPNITWYHGKEIVDSTDGKVLVKNEHCENTTYHCHAKNDAGNAYCSVLTVRAMSFCEKKRNNVKGGRNRLLIIIAVIVCTLVLFVLILTIILVVRRVKYPKRETKGPEIQNPSFGKLSYLFTRGSQVMEESPYGEPVDAIHVRTSTAVKDADYATVEETGYKRGTTDYAQKPQSDKSSKKKMKPTAEPVYAKVHKKSKKKNTSADVPLNSLYAEIPASLSNAKRPSTHLTTSQQHTPASNNDEDGVDSGQESWFSSGE